VISGREAEVRGSQFAVSANPLGNITEIQRVKFAMKGGKVIRDELTRTAAGAGSH